MAPGAPGSTGGFSLWSSSSLTASPSKQTLQAHFLPGLSTFDLNAGGAIRADQDLIWMCDGGLLEVLVLNKTGLVFRPAECPLCFASVRTTNRLDTCTHSTTISDGFCEVDHLCRGNERLEPPLASLIQGTKIEFL